MWDILIVGMIAFILGGAIGAFWAYGSVKHDAIKLRWLEAMARDYRASHVNDRNPMTKEKAWDWCYDILMEAGPEDKNRIRG